MKGILPAIVAAAIAIPIIAMAIFLPADEKPIDGFAARIFKSRTGTMPYRLFSPAVKPQERYPVVIWLHGAGGAGMDNKKQIQGDQVAGTRIWTKKDNQAKHPAYVLVPQSPGVWADELDEMSTEGRLVIEILESLKKELPIDPNRVYLSGQSNGGIGTWNLITEKPELFAAAIPLCGEGDTKRARKLVNLPIWAFHGEKDDVIAVSYSRDMIAAIRKAGGNPRYTEYKNVDHNVWTPAFKEPGLVEWLFAQHK